MTNLKVDMLHFINVGVIKADIFNLNDRICICKEKMASGFVTVGLLPFLI